MKGLISDKLYHITMVTALLFAIAAIVFCFVVAYSEAINTPTEQTTPEPFQLRNRAVTTGQHPYHGLHRQTHTTGRALYGLFFTALN